MTEYRLPENAEASIVGCNIMQIVKENCSVDFSGTNPNDDLERLLHQRKGF